MSIADVALTGKTFRSEQTRETNGFWTRERVAILTEGLPEAKEQAVKMMRTLHPRMRGGKERSSIEERLAEEQELNGVRVPKWKTPEFWQREIERALRGGIWSSKQGRAEAIKRIRTHWSKLDPQGLEQYMHALAAAELPAWYQNGFWREGADKILLKGIRRVLAIEEQEIASVVADHPRITIDIARARLAELRKLRSDEELIGKRPQSWDGVYAVTNVAAERTNGLISSNQKEKADQALWRVMEEVERVEATAMANVLKLYPDLEREATAARLRYLRSRQKSEDVDRREVQLPKEEMDKLIREKLLGQMDPSTCRALLSELAALTGWPSRELLRRARRLGFAIAKTKKTWNNWNAVDLCALVYSFKEDPVKKIGSHLNRSEAAVWCQLSRQGLHYRNQEEYTRAYLRDRVHVGWGKIQFWINAGYLTQEENGRITKFSLGSFFLKHLDRLNWNRLDAKTQAWIVNLVENARQG